jgi:hypothetical protein
MEYKNIKKKNKKKKRKDVDGIGIIRTWWYGVEVALLKIISATISPRA